MLVLLLELLSMVFWFVFSFAVILVMVNDKAADRLYRSRNKIARVLSLNTFYAIRWYIVMPFYWVICKLDMRNSKIDSQMPVKAYKYAMLGFMGFDSSPTNTYTFLPSTSNKNQFRIHYSTTDIAHCRSGHNHRSPDDNCLCGFYGIKRKSLLGKIKGNWRPTRRSRVPLFTLEVEHYGKIIESIFGYRSEKQRVLRVSVKKRCAFCTLHRRHGPFYICREAIGFAIFNSPFEKPSYVLPVCKRHSPPVVISTQDIANDLGTEVVWS